MIRHVALNSTDTSDSGTAIENRLETLRKTPCVIGHGRMEKTKRTTGVKPQKMNVYPSFAAWKRDQSSENQRLIDALSRLVKRTAPEFAPTVKWGQGCWTRNGVPKVYIHTESDHVQCGFYAGSTLRDPEALLVGRGKHVRHVKVHTTKGIPRKALVRFLEQVRQ